jgi:hypothetical protein
MVGAVRVWNVRGPDGVVGVRGRIGFIHTTGTVRRAWFDPCYTAFAVVRHRCSPDRVRVATETRFHDCQYRATNLGTAGGGCPGRLYPRYYSDHPIVRAVLR